MKNMHDLRMICMGSKQTLDERIKQLQVMLSQNFNDAPRRLEVILSPRDPGVYMASKARNQGAKYRSLSEYLRIIHGVN